MILHCDANVYIIRAHYCKKNREVLNMCTMCAAHKGKGKAPAKGKKK